MADEKELKDQRVPIMMKPSELEAIDDWMFGRRIRSRGEAIRRLTAAGLALDKGATDLLTLIVRDMDRVDEHIRKQVDLLSPTPGGAEITTARAAELALASLEMASEYEEIAWSVLTQTGDLVAESLEHRRDDRPNSLPLRDRFANLIASIREALGRK